MIYGLPLFWQLVLAVGLILGGYAAYNLTKLDDTEKHDEAVRLRWKARRESTPPDWADPEKWWESEGWH